MSQAVISSRDNPKIKALRALAEDPREPRKQGRTLADGIHLVTTCLDRGADVQFLLVSESGLEHPEIAPLLVRAGKIEHMVVRDSLYREISGVASPTGIAAVINIPLDPGYPTEGDLVVLEMVQDSGNVGAILRTAAAAGVCNIVLGPGCAGAWTPRVLRAGQGAHFSLRIRECADLNAVLAVNSAITVATVAREGTSLYELDLKPPLAWLFGNEGSGLSAGLTAAAQQRVTIPLATTTESLNVAAAAAVCLFEASRQRRLLQI